MAKRIELNDSMLENVSGGSFGANANPDGTFKVKGEFTQQVFDNVSLADLMRVCQYAATQPNTEEGELNIIAWAQAQGIF